MADGTIRVIIDVGDGGTTFVALAPFDWDTSDPMNLSFEDSEEFLHEWMLRVFRSGELREYAERVAPTEAING